MNRRVTFYGYAATTSVTLWYDQDKNTFGRAHISRIVNGYFHRHTKDNPVPATVVLQGLKLPLPENNSSLAEIKGPFHPDDLYSYQVTIPLSGPLSVTIEDDPYFGLPLIKDILTESPFRKSCPRKFWRQSWVVNIHHEEPITARRMEEYIEHLREEKILTFTVTLTERVTMQNTRYEEFRTYFDNFRPVVGSANKTSLYEFPSTAFAVQSPVAPIAPVFWGQVKYNDFKEQWYKAIFERYDKNHTVGLNSVPISTTRLPPGTKIVNSIPTFKIKKSYIINIDDLYYRMCLNGSKQVKGQDYQESYAPTGQYVSIRISIALAATFRLTAYAMDIDNAFQTTPKIDNAESPPTFISIPPMYIEWFKDRFPKIIIEGPAPFVLQQLNFMQGNRSAGREFHELLKLILAQIGIHPTSIDKGTFDWNYRI